MATDVKRPFNQLWPNPGEIDQAVNRRAQAMARTGKEFSRSDSDAAADQLISELFGRNAEVESSQRSKIRELLWNDYDSYPKGYRGFHLTGPGKKESAWKREHAADAAGRRLRLHRALDHVMDRMSGDSIGTLPANGVRLYVNKDMQSAERGAADAVVIPEIRAPFQWRIVYSDGGQDFFKTTQEALARINRDFPNHIAEPR